ncbi:MAG: hypothetical protein RLN85_18900 [Pseudomonadales bacterium]
MSNLAEVANKLETLIRLTAIGLFADKSQREKIELLGTAGLPAKEIAEILGTTPNTVSVTLSGLRKKKKKIAPKKKNIGVIQ